MSFTFRKFQSSLDLVLLVDRILDFLASRNDAAGRRNWSYNVHHHQSFAPGIESVHPGPATQTIPDRRVSTLSGAAVGVHVDGNDLASQDERDVFPLPLLTPASPIMSGPLRFEYE